MTVRSCLVGLSDKPRQAVTTLVEGDVRRINVTLHEGTPAEMLLGIRTSIARGFDMEEASLPMLKYRDEEGDLC